MAYVLPRPLTPEAVVAEVASRIDGLSDREDERVLRVLVDGAPAAGGAVLADALVEPLRVRGRACLRVSGSTYLRAASLRLEHGREDVQAFAEDWLDVDALRREALDPLGPGGSGRWLPSLRDPDTDRATRATYQLAAPRSVLVVDGSLLLGRGLPAELTVHLSLSGGALKRRTPDAEQWTLPAYANYAERVRPQDLADVVVRVDDPRHPALLTSGSPGRRRD
jgi:hypothetical protein